MTDTHDPQGTTPDPIENGAPTPTDPAAADPVQAATPAERVALSKARDAAGERLEAVAGRVREMGNQAVERNKLLKPTRSLAYNAADGIDHAAEYVRTRAVDGMRSDLERTVRRHPIAAVVVAFWAGYTLRRIF